jgi:hypothetical protein
MVVGDVVNEIGAIASPLTFQPAATVECLISTAGNGTGGAWMLLTNAAGAFSYLWDTSATTNNYRSNIKLFINNTNFLYISTAIAGEYANFTGIQIK